MSNTEDDIHEMYSRYQRNHQRSHLEMRRALESSNPDPLLGRQAYYSNSSSWNVPTFRSQFFHVGEGLKVVAPGDTVILAKKVVPQQHVGVLTGLIQIFMDCEAESINAITWGLRIDGQPVRDFNDFIGEFSKSYLPMEVFFPLTGGAQTLGTTSYSPGSGPTDGIPTVAFQATNNHPTQSVILQARVIGYTRPVAERMDEFGSL